MTTDDPTKPEEPVEMAEEQNLLLDDLDEKFAAFQTLRKSDPGAAEFSASIHNAFATIVDYTPRFIFGSLLAYYVSQHFDVWAFHKIKSLTGERWLWLRNNGSTLSSQIVDTTIYSLVAWWGIVDLVTALQLGAAKYLFKIIIAGIDTVFIYWARASFRRRNVHEAA